MRARRSESRANVSMKSRSTKNTRARPEYFCARKRLPPRPNPSLLLVLPRLHPRGWLPPSSSPRSRPSWCEHRPPDSWKLCSSPASCRRPPSRIILEQLVQRRPPRASPPPPPPLAPPRRVPIRSPSAARTRRSCWGTRAAPRPKRTARITATRVIAATPSARASDPSTGSLGLLEPHPSSRASPCTRCARARRRRRDEARARTEAGRRRRRRGGRAHRHSDRVGAEVELNRSGPRLGQHLDRDVCDWYHWCLYAGAAGRGARGRRRRRTRRRRRGARRCVVALGDPRAAASTWVERVALEHRPRVRGAVEGVAMPRRRCALALSGRGRPPAPRPRAPPRGGRA